MTGDVLPVCYLVLLFLQGEKEGIILSGPGVDNDLQEYSKACSASSICPKESAPLRP